VTCDVVVRLAWKGLKVYYAQREREK